MDIVKIKGFTAVAGEDQGYEPLPIRREVVPITLNPPGEEPRIVKAPQLVSAWKPTAAELARLNTGCAVILTTLGHNPQPCRLHVDGYPIREGLGGDAFAPGEYPLPE